MARLNSFEELDNMRALLERRVHAFISKDNDKLMKAGGEAGLRALRRQEGSDRPARESD